MFELYCDDGMCRCLKVTGEGMWEGEMKGERERVREIELRMARVKISDRTRRRVVRVGEGG